MNSPASHVNPETPDAKSKKDKNLEKYFFIRKIINSLITVYILCYIYRNLHVNEVDYSSYIKPITANIPFWPFIIASFLVEYIIENLKKNTKISKENLEQDFVTTTATILSQNPLKLAGRFYWNSIKMMFKYMGLAILISIPIMLIISIIQIFMTGNSVPGKITFQ